MRSHDPRKIKLNLIQWPVSKDKIAEFTNSSRNTLNNGNFLTACANFVENIISTANSIYTTKPSNNKCKPPTPRVWWNCQYSLALFERKEAFWIYKARPSQINWNNYNEVAKLATKTFQLVTCYLLTLILERYRVKLKQEI